jgi:hypothetical protein
MPLERHRSTLLRRALLANACFSAASGAAFCFAPSAGAGFAGGFAPSLIALTGGGLLLFGAGVLRLALADRPGVIEARVVIALDVGWVLASAGLWLAVPDSFTDAGRAGLALVAAIVLHFAAMQTAGVRRLTSTLDAGASSHG